MRSFLFFSICFFSFFQARTQVPQFRSLEVAKKIADIQVMQVEQDDAGYLWLGTNAGILRYDGLTYKEIPIPDSLKRTRVSALIVSGDVVAAGFENGVIMRFNTQNQDEIAVKKVCNVPVTALVAEKNGSLWIGTNGEGIALFDGTNVVSFATSTGLADNYVHCLAMVNNHLAVGTDLGLSLCAYSNGNFSCNNKNIDDGLSDNLILSFCPHGEDNLLIGMQNGSVCNYNIGSGRIDHFERINALSLSPIDQLLILENDILAISEKDGAFIINWQERQQLQQFFLNPAGNIETDISDCLVDQEGNLIIANETNMLTLADFRVQFILEHDGQPFSNAQCLMSDKEGNIWFANDAGIFKHPSEFTKDQLIEHIYASTASDAKIISLCEGMSRDIWFGTFGSGLGHIDPNTNSKTIYTEKDGLVNNNVLSIARQDSSLWMATLGGACRLQMINGKPVFKTFDAQSPLGSSYVYCVFVDLNGRVWFGTDGKGLALYENDSFTFLRDKFPDVGRSVVSITEDTKGNLWFFSPDKGLQWTDGNSLHHVEISTESEKAEVYAIHGDPLGKVIVLSSVGLAAVSAENSVATFIRSDLDLKANYLNVVARDLRGRMWMGTEGSMIRFREFNQGRVQRPKMHIENVLVLLQPIDTSLHGFKYDQNHFTFEITALWLQQPEALTYQYKLSGYDVDWVNTRDRVITFPQLQPGSYTFYVRAAANNNWKDAAIESYSFNIGEPWWKNAWFFIGISAGLILLLLLLVRIRLNSLKRRESLSRERLQSQFDSLRNQVNPHFLFNSFNTLISIISNNKEEAIGFVEKLSDYFRIVLEQRDKDVISVKEELSLVNSYLYLQQRRFGDNLKVEVELSDAVQASAIPPLTLQLLVENAIKHNVISKTKALSVSIRSMDSHIMVRNTIREKITREASTGIGLENIRSRYRILFHKEISVVKTETEFIVSLPIITE